MSHKLKVADEEVDKITSRATVRGLIWPLIFSHTDNAEFKLSKKDLMELRGAS